jgi:hypothetical protein
MKKAESSAGTKVSTQAEERWRTAVQEFSQIMEEAFDKEKALKLNPAEIEGWLSDVCERAKARLLAGHPGTADEKRQGEESRDGQSL